MSETKVNLPNSADIYWHDGGKSAESFAEELVSLRTRVSELESNEAAYESILGPRTYNEVAEHIRGLERALRWIVNSPSAHPANMVKVAEDALEKIS